MKIQAITPRLLADTFEGTTERWWIRRRRKLRELKLIRKQGRKDIGDLDAIGHALLTQDLSPESDGR